MNYIFNSYFFSFWQGLFFYWGGWLDNLNYCCCIMALANFENITGYCLESGSAKIYLLFFKWVAINWYNFAGNLTTVNILACTELGFKLFFSRLIILLCIFDTFCIILNIPLFSLPLLSETFRHQVGYIIHIHINKIS